MFAQIHRNRPPSYVCSKLHDTSDTPSSQYIMHDRFLVEIHNVLLDSLLHDIFEVLLIVV